MCCGSAAACQFAAEVEVLAMGLFRQRDRW
jgi:hypothetical protein